MIFRNSLVDCDIQAVKSISEHGTEQLSMFICLYEIMKNKLFIANNERLELAVLFGSPVDDLLWREKI